MAALLTRRVVLAGKNSVDLETRTAEAVLCSAAAVQRHGERPDGSFGKWIERLDVDGARLDQGPLPLLLDHDHTQAASRVGVAENIRREGDKVVATLRFSAREDVAPLLRDLAEFGGGLSVGYSVKDWKRMP